MPAFFSWALDLVLGAAAVAVLLGGSGSAQARGASQWANRLDAARLPCSYAVSRQQ